MRPLLLLGAAVLLTTSCGGGGGDKQLTKSEFEDQMGAILRPLNETTLVEIAIVSPANGPQAVRVLKHIENSLHGAATKLNALEPPADAQAPTSQLAGAVDQLAGRVGAMRKGAEQGNFAKLEQFKLQGGSDPAVSQIRKSVVDLINLGYNITGGAP